MPLTPQDVVRKDFREAFRGYNQADVDLFLDEVVDEMQRLVEENQRLKVRVTALQQELARYRPGEPAQPAETSEARWRLRRFLEEQGRPLDEIDTATRSPTVERIAREVPQPPDEPAVTGAGQADAPPHDTVSPPRRDPAPPPRREPPPPVPPAVRPPAPAPGGAAAPGEGEARQTGKERPWDRDDKPFWAAE